MASTKTEYYLRLLLLIVNVATPALRETFFRFVAKSSTKSVDDFLKVFEDGFKALKSKRILKDSELKKLFPNSGKTVIKEWDISLLCLVLSHCCSLEGKLYQLRDILLKEAKYNINNFVQTNKNIIDSMKGAELGDEEYVILFPADSSDTKFEKWNSQLIMQIVLKLCPAKKQNMIKVLRDTFIQEIDLKCSSNDINAFLNMHLSTFVDLKNKGKLSQAQFDNLFPKTGTDINTWDDHTLQVIILNTTSSLNKKTIKPLKKIRSIRSDFLAHRGDAEMELSEFSEKRIELTKAVIKILKEEKQPAVEVKQNISNIVDGPLEINSAIECLKAYYTKESLEKDKIIGALDDVRESMGLKMEAGFGKVDSRLDAFLEHLESIERKLPESAYTEKAEIRCVDMIFVIKSETVEKKEKAESLILNAMKQAQENTTEQIQAAFDVIRKIITEDGKIIVEIKRGSVIVVIKCISLKGFHRLLKYVHSDQMQTHLAKAALALDDLIGRHTEITVSMSYDSLVNASEDIVSYLTDYIEHTSHLKMTIERNNVQDLQNLVREFQVGEGATQLRILSSNLSEYLGESISVDALTPTKSKDQHQFKGISDNLVGANIATLNQFELSANKLQLPGTSDNLEETNLATLSQFELSDTQQLPETNQLEAPRQQWRVELESILKGFFKRSITRGDKYKCFFGGECDVTPKNRNRCKSCRFRRCLETRMSVESVRMGRIPKVEKEKALVAFYQGGADYMNVELKVQQTGAGTYDFHLDPKSESGTHDHRKHHPNTGNDEEGFHMIYDGQSSEESVEVKKEPGDFYDLPINDCEMRSDPRSHGPHGLLPSASVYSKQSHQTEAEFSAHKIPTATVTSDSLDRGDRNMNSILEQQYNGEHLNTTKKNQFKNTGNPHLEHKTYTQLKQMNGFEHDDNGPLRKHPRVQRSLSEANSLPTMLSSSLKNVLHEDTSYLQKDNSNYGNANKQMPSDSSNFRRHSDSTSQSYQMTNSSQGVYRYSDEEIRNAANVLGIDSKSDLSDNRSFENMDQGQSNVSVVLKQEPIGPFDDSTQKCNTNFTNPRDSLPNVRYFQDQYDVGHSSSNNNTYHSVQRPFNDYTSTYDNPNMQNTDLQQTYNSNMTSNLQYRNYDTNHHFSDSSNRLSQTDTSVTDHCGLMSNSSLHSPLPGFNSDSQLSIPPQCATPSSVISCDESTTSSSRSRYSPALIKALLSQLLHPSQADQNIVQAAQAQLLLQLIVSETKKKPSAVTGSLSTDNTSCLSNLPENRLEGMERLLQDLDKNQRDVYKDPDTGLNASFDSLFNLTTGNYPREEVLKAKAKNDMTLAKLQRGNRHSYETERNRVEQTNSSGINDSQQMYTAKRTSNQNQINNAGDVAYTATRHDHVSSSGGEAHVVETESDRQKLERSLESMGLAMKILYRLKPEHREKLTLYEKGLIHIRVMTDSDEDVKEVYGKIIGNIPLLNERILGFCGNIPGFASINKDDQGKLLKRAYYDIWMLTFSEYFHDRKSSMLLTSGEIYSHEAMRKILNDEIVDTIMDFADAFNALNLTDKEISILCAVRLTSPEQLEIGDRKPVQALNSHLMDVLAYEVKRNHPGNHVRLLMDMFQIMPQLAIINELKKQVIGTFKVDRFSKTDEKTITKQEDDASVVEPCS